MRLGYLGLNINQFFIQELMEFQVDVVDATGTNSGAVLTGKMYFKGSPSFGQMRGIVYTIGFALVRILPRRIIKFL